MATNHFIPITVICFGLISGCLSTLPEPDECINHAILPDSLVRTSASSSEVSSPICDSEVPEGWYKVLPLPGAQQHRDILWVRSNADAPNLNTCGTESPLFLVSTTSPYPDAPFNKMVNVTLKGRYTSTDVRNVGTVNITDCNEFRVYKLPALDLTCNFGYCFNDVPDYKNGTLEVIYEVVNNELVFTCTRSNVETVSGNEPPNLLFQWYMKKTGSDPRGQQLIHEVTVPQNFNQADTQLRQSHWINRIKLGVEVDIACILLDSNNANTLCLGQITCKMSGVSASNITGSPLVSNPFYAGLEVVQDEDDTVNGIFLQGDGSYHTITVRATVPVLCVQPIQSPDQCPEKLEINILTQNTGQTACTSEEHSDSGIIMINNAACGSSIHVGSGFAELPSTNITVIGRRGVLYQGDDEATLKIRVTTDPENKALSHWYHDLRELRITIGNVNSVYSDYTCEIFNNLHVKTFARTFHSNADMPGTYTVYKHSNLPIKVQARFDPCPWKSNSNFSCICGVAVLSGENVFIHDYCEKKINGTEEFGQYLRTGVVACEHKTMELEDYENGGFKITLPTGTVVWVPKTITRTYTNSNGEKISYLDMGSLRLTSAPQNYGHESIEGLCGVIPGRSGTDLKMENGILTTNITEFGDEWRNKNVPLDVLQNDLFQYPGGGGPSRLVQRACDEDEGAVECGVYEAGTRCNAKTLVDVAINCQRERDTNHGRFNEFAVGAFIFPDYTNFNVSTPTWRNSWTETSAQENCAMFLTNNTSPECRYVIGEEFNARVRACVEGIKVTGDEDTSFRQTTLDTTLQSCLNNGTYNTDLLVPSQDGILAPSPTLHSRLCPSACNLRGTCSNGVCQCTETYSGAACELDLSIKPSNLRIPHSGFCDLSQQECDEAIVYGTGFHSDGQPVCNISKTTAQGDLLDSTQVTAVIVSSGKAICPLSTDMRVISHDLTAVHGGDFPSVYNIAISNDYRRGNLSYSSSVAMTVVDGTCFDRSSFPERKGETRMNGNVCSRIAPQITGMQDSDGN